MKQLLAAFALAALAAPAFAQETDTPSETAEAPACMVALELTPQLVFTARDWAQNYAAANGEARQLLFGYIPPTEIVEGLADNLRGAVVFMQDREVGWRAMMPAPWESIVAVYQEPESGETILFTQVQTEGPGQSWTFIRSEDNLHSATCTSIDFPDALNNPEWANETLELVDFDMNEGGLGEIIARASVERDGAPATWFFTYSTTNAGLTWSAPERIEAERAAASGAFEPANVYPSSAGQDYQLTAFVTGADALE